MIDPQNTFAWRERLTDESMEFILIDMDRAVLWLSRSPICKYIIYKYMRTNISSKHIFHITVKR